MGKDFVSREARWNARFGQLVHRDGGAGMLEGGRVGHRAELGIPLVGTGTDLCGGDGVEGDGGDVILDGFWAGFVAEPAFVFPGGTAAPAGGGGGLWAGLQSCVIGAFEAPFVDHLRYNVVDLIFSALEGFHLHVEAVE